MDNFALSRRAFAAQAAALGAALAFRPTSARATTVAGSERRDLFPQGVASGDPRADSVILWTRRAPDDGATSHRLTVEVANDPAFARVVARRCRRHRGDRLDLSLPRGGLKARAGVLVSLRRRGREHQPGRPHADGAGGRGRSRGPVRLRQLPGRHPGRLQRLPAHAP